ncbi:putative PEP-binding protein [Escherichia coli]
MQAVHRQGKWIGLCGELGAKGSVLPLLVGLGMDEIEHERPVDSGDQSASGAARQPRLPPVAQPGDGLPHLAGSGAPARPVPYEPAGCAADYPTLYFAR